MSTKLVLYLVFTIRINKSSLYYLYFKLKYNYKNLKNKDKDIKFLDLFKSQLETITIRVLFTTNCNIKLNQFYHIYLFESQKKLNVIIVIPIITKTQLLHRIYIYFKMLEFRNFTKTGLQDLHYFIQLCHITFLSTALRNIFINREIHYVIGMAYLGTPLFNIILLCYYLELSLVTWEICNNIRFLSANSIFLFPLKHITVKSLFETVNNLIIILALQIQILS